MKREAFTLVELIIYIAMFAGASVLLTSMLITILKVQNREALATDVSSQLAFVLDTTNRLVRESSLIEKVYEGSNETAPCAKYCSVKLRMPKTSEDPTIVSSDAAGIYLKQGIGAATLLTNDKIIVTNLNFRADTVARGHSILSIDASLKYNSTDPKFLIVRSIKSAVGRVSAATFDDHLLPAGDNLSDVGQSPGKRWRNLWFGGDGVIEGNLILGANSMPAMTGTTSLFVPNGKYAQFQNNGAGAPPAVDCDQDVERGRFYIDTTNNRFYVCNGATRNWDYAPLTN